MSLPMNEQTLEREGCRLHYWTGGKAGAPLVVFTHGATIDHHEWDATLPLVGENYRVLTWDVRGHGLSRPAPFDLAKSIGDLLALLDIMKVEAATFIGHSMGGQLGTGIGLPPSGTGAKQWFSSTAPGTSRSSRRWRNFTLKLAGPIFDLYPYKTLVNQSLAVTATSKELQELLRASMGCIDQG